MDDRLDDKNPYKDMNTAGDEIRPEALGGINDNVGSSGRIGSLVGDKTSKKANGKLTGAVGELKKGEDAATGGFYKGSGNPLSVKQGEQEPTGRFTGKGRENKAGIKGQNKGKKKIDLGKILSTTIIAVVLGMVGIMMLGMASGPILTASIDYNLQDSLGFGETSEVLEEQGSYITQEALKKGRLPDGFADDLAMAGIQAGQVTVAGTFVRTNKYIDNIEELDEVAAIGEGYYANGGEGELAVLFEGDLIEADNFVAAMDTNPRLLIAFSDAMDVTARFYYSNEVEQVYRDMGLSRGSFNGWDATGDSKKDQEEYEKILKKVLDDDVSKDAAGRCDTESYIAEDGTEMGGCNDPRSMTSGDATTIISGAAYTAGNGAPVEGAAEILNAAISSEEPYRAAKAFLAVEESIQRSRIDGDGPTNEMMNVLSQPTEVTYTDVETGELKTVKQSVVNTQNFVAAASGGVYSIEEAENFSRDREMNLTNANNARAIIDTTVHADGRNTFDITIGTHDTGVDLGVAENSVDVAIVQDNSELFPSIVGANRIVEGGAFLSDTINGHVLGAMPSDEETTLSYNRHVETLLARKAKAERETLSPFDISSPNTLMGSIVHGFASAMLQSGALTSGGMGMSLVSTVASTTGNSIGGLIDGVVADGKDDRSYRSLFGKGCNTVKQADVSGDLSCSQNNTMYTEEISNTKEVWEAKVESATIMEGMGGGGWDGYERFLTAGGGRWSTVGISDAGICLQYEHSVWENIAIFFASFLGIYDECLFVPENVRTNALYALSDSNPFKSAIQTYSGYTLYDTVAAMLEGTQSESARIKEQYYAEHPVDNSRAGVLARRSGLSKEEVQIALDYADYLTMVASYNAASRYAFGVLDIDASPTTALDETQRTTEEWYYMWRRENEYGDARNRSFAV